MQRRRRGMLSQVVAACSVLLSTACAGDKAGQPAALEPDASAGTPFDAGSGESTPDASRPGTAGTGGMAGQDTGGAPSGGAPSGGMGEGGSSPEGMQPSDAAQLSFESFPPLGAEGGQAYRYRVVLDRSGPAHFALDTGPAGASIDENGIITWTPSSQQSGKHSFSVSASLNGLSASQDFKVSVSSLSVAAAELLAADSELTQTISIASPLSAASGVALSVPPGSLRAASEISIATAHGTSALPGATADSESGLVIGLGPSGEVFNEPLDLLLPLSETARQRISAGEAVASAWTLGAAGRWQPLAIAQLDLDNGYALLKPQHFSMFSVLADTPLLSVAGIAAGSSACTDALFMDVGLSDAAVAGFASAWLNGDLGEPETTSIPALLQALPDGKRLQVVLRAHLTTADGGRDVQRYRAVNIRKRAADSFDLDVSTGDGDRLFERLGIAAQAGEITQALKGAYTHFVFRGLAEATQGQVELQAFAYLRDNSGDDGVPASEGQAFAATSAGFGSLTPGDGDGDCDGVLDGADATPQGAVPPSVSCVGESTRRGAVGAELDLAIDLVAAQADQTTLTWTTDSPDTTIEPSADGLRATARSAMTGTHKVMVEARDAAGTGTAVFTLFIDSSSTTNTAPHCQIGAKRTTLFTGDSVALEAVLSDAEQADSELSVAWSASAGATLSSDHGRKLSFTAQTPAQYEVSCVASDGFKAGPVNTLVLSVVERPLNTPPRLELVTPTSATLTLDAESGLAAQRITATASDIDGDAVNFDFALLDGDGSLSPLDVTQAATSGQFSSARRFESTAPGPFSVLVRAIDQNGAASEAFLVQLLVVESLDATDNDADGYPSSADCNDADDSIYPGAPEICGDGIDQNCSGGDRSLADCDQDRDGVSQNAGDCDDQKPGVFPGAFERCNGRDDNCDGKTDEGYVVGSDCKVGTGACAKTGTMQCTQSGLAAVCSAKPGEATVETCNGLDDDCNGAIDDVPTTGALDITNCGGCGLSCVPADNQIPMCTLNAAGKAGCTFGCISGYHNLDGSPLNGCEYACDPNGLEACNGLDDDCDGKVDEDTSASFYTGPAGTLGVGVCRSGLAICSDAQLSVGQDQIEPSAERCDGRDNDCDGRTDEDFALGTVCDGPDTDLCPNGKRVCAPDGTVICGLEAKQNLLDVCDGVDNDCDGQTNDGSADPMLGGPCDDANPAYCEPGKLVCSAGALVCSNAGRDDQSCKACACDTTLACDTNGTGYYCRCDPNCVTPDGCSCDVSASCDLVDGSVECGCDPQCTGDTPCSCDQKPNECDLGAGGFACACDKLCGPEAGCNCDVTAASCDTASGGDACLCDHDCYPTCPCDDGDPSACAKDAEGNACMCDPSCGPVGTPVCGCDVSASICDKTLDGGDCLCDGDCYPDCPCDDQNAQTCAHDSDGNLCRCDPSCPGDCACDTTADTCDVDPSTGAPCGCDPNCAVQCPCDDHDPTTCAQNPDGTGCDCDPGCSPPACTCDTAAASCDIDPSTGKPCTCDPDCSPPACDCDLASGSCETDPASGGACTCDPDCNPPACDCDSTPDTCDAASGGDLCLCDRDCYPECPCDDFDPTTCASDSDGNVCKCDPGCEPATAPNCACDAAAGSCDTDPSSGLACDCDPDCGAPPACTCDLAPGSCDQTAGGDPCLCDADCYPACPCDDADPAFCVADSDGHVCECDPSCHAACTCDTAAASCDIDPSTGKPCTCDPDCSPPACDCDGTPDTCDVDPSTGAPCGCDPNCAVQCPCDDHDPTTCAQNPDGTSCDCDPGCSPPACDCDLASGSCETDPTSGGACTCDPDCNPPACDCDSTPDTCDAASGGDLCLCDRDCYPECPCDDFDPTTCASDSDGNVCKCDPGCEPATAPNCACDAAAGSCDTDPSSGLACDCDPDCGAPPACTCDLAPGSCDQTAGGDPCLCDADCYPACPCDDQDPSVCVTDSDGHICECDPSCHADCPCDLAAGSCSVDPSTGAICDCDPDCAPPACDCDATPDACDNTATGEPCACDPNCAVQCPCDDHDPSTCAQNPDGTSCDCDPGCSPPTCACDLASGSCEADPATGGACGCDPDCSPPACACDAAPGSCDTASAGDACLCDRDCYPECTCDDQNPDTCATDSDGNPCQCDPSCTPTTAPGCSCDAIAGSCDTDASSGLPCDCDPDCGAPAACSCDIAAGSCDLTAGGDACLCDADCYPACPCDDGDPAFCVRDSDDHICECDPSCH